MYAVVGNEYGLIYPSVVFGHYKEIFKGKEHDYYIVLNESKDRLVKKYDYERKSKDVYEYVSLMDLDVSDWNLSNKNYGQIDFFDSSLPDLVSNDSVTLDLLSKCIEIDNAYDYKKWNDIQTEEDIKKLDDFVCNFHDAYVSNISLNKEDDSVTLTMGGIGHFSVEMCFYDWASFNARIYDVPADYWYCSNMYFKDGYFCLINDDECGITTDNYDYTWFRGKKAKYRIVPDL